MASVSVTRRIELDAATRFCGKDEKLYLRPKCHPTAPTWSVYSDGTLTSVCSVCNVEIMTVAVR